jgi:hypothetical protein
VCTLTAYLERAEPILSVVLQIPPTKPSGALRVTLLLRLTGDVIGAFGGYAPDDADARDTLLAFFDLLDAGWLAVLCTQAWDPKALSGIDDSTGMEVDDSGASGYTMSATERARLRSLVAAATDNLAEWLSKAPALDAGDASRNVDDAVADLTTRRGFEDAFLGTLSEMGVLGGSVPLVPPEIISPGIEETS